MPKYAKQTWQNGQVGSTPISAARLNHMEEGIARAKSGTAFTPLKQMLDEATTRPMGLQLIGDSTGNDATEWPRLWINTVRALYPAVTFQECVWNTGTEIMGNPNILQTGTAGLQHVLVETGKTTPCIPHAQAPAFPAVADIRIKMAADDWSSAAANTVLAGRENGAAQRQWWIALNTTGLPSLVLSSDGTALTTIFATANVPFADGATGWLRVVHVVNDGAGNRVTRFYTSTNGSTWTQLGATVTTAGVITPFTPTNANLTIGGRGGASGLPGKIYEFHFLDAENGADLVPPLPGSWAMTPFGTNMSILGSPTFTTVLGSHSGADAAILSDATRIKKMTPNYGQRVILISDSHNEGGKTASDFITPYNTLIEAAKGRIPGVPVGLLTQNPQNGAVNASSHAARRWDIVTFAQAKGYDVWDIFKEFEDDDRPIGDLLLDQIHPNDAGSALWASVLSDAFANS